MGRQAPNLQDSFLNQVRRDAVPVTVYLVNGVQIRGVVRAFDNFTVFIESDGRQLMIYKHALSTLIPASPVPIAVLEGRGRAGRGEGGPDGDEPVDRPGLR